MVPGGQSATVPLKGAPAVKAATREGVVLPSRQGLRVFHTGLRQISVTWDEIEGTQSWRVQLSQDPNFENVVRDGVVHDNFVSVPVRAKGNWYWRVFKGELEHARGSAFFAPEPRAADLSRLKNVVPEGAETTTIFFQDKDKPPVINLTWGKDEAAAKYAVKVYREGALNNAVAQRTVAENQLALPENTLVEGKYLWSVTLLDSKGGELKGGRMNKWNRDQMAARVATDIPEGAYVNLGIGLPTLVANHLPKDREVFLHSENGILGMGPAPVPGEEDFDLINAGKQPVTLLPGGAYFHHADSFGMMRGGHLDICVLGAFQVSITGDLANWHTGAADAIPAVGGAMDLAIGARKTYVMMELLTKSGESKIVSACTYPLTGIACVSRVYSDLAVIDITPNGLHVIDIVDNLSLQELQKLIGVPLIPKN